jgi:hypothetical protein
MTVSVRDIAKQMLALLPEDGTPVLNRVMRVMLSRDLEATIDQDDYFAARDLLLKQGRVGVQRGQGGQIFFLPPPKTAAPLAPPPASVREWTEALLMEPLRQYLVGPFQRGLDLPPEAAWIVQDTSTLGDRQGRWARPDFILVSAMRFKLLPGAQVDVHSFELKTEKGATVLAVHEALAQTRFTHFGHVVWHLPEKSKEETRLAEVEEQCSEHGIGLIRMRDPRDARSCEILVDPRRKSTMPAIVEGFLEKRLSNGHREKILAVVNGTHS